MSEDLIHHLSPLAFRAVPTSPNNYPAKRFVLGLDPVARRDFLVAAQVLATSCSSGRPPSGRASRVAGSRQKLFELRITPPGRRGPHHRLLYIRDQNTIWVVRGLTKRERLSRNDIDLADHAVRRWRIGR